MYNPVGILGYYEVSTGCHYAIGDYAKYKGKKLYIYQIKAVLENEELVFVYRLGEKCHFLGTERPNRKLAGAILYGRVERTEGESVYLKLEIDGKNGKAAYPFAWAPPTGNLAYCMPQMGTRACLYVPDCYGQEAIAVSSVHTNGGSSCFSDVQNKGLVTEHGKQLLLQADALCLTDGCQKTVLGGDRLYLQVGKGKCSLRAGEGIYIQAPSVTVKTPLAINQYSAGEKGKDRKNPATGGGETSFQSQYEFSISSPLGELIGTAYEEYKPFENEIEYESYEAVEKRRLEGLAAGILTALAVGALVAAVVFTGGAALGVALAVGAVVAGVGSIAAAVTYMHDKENSTASELGTYINNARTASLITAAVIAVFWAAPYGAKALATEVTQGLPVTVLFGEVYTVEQIASPMSVGTEGIALLNAFFQMCELGMFFSGTKELGEPTESEGYDKAKERTEMAAEMLFLLGVSQWFKDKITKKQPVNGSETPKVESETPKTESKKPVTGAGTGNGDKGFTNQYCLSGQEHFEALKEMFGADNVEWVSRDTLSYADRLRIQNWGDNAPIDEIYIKYKDVFQNDLYYNQATGQILWPDDNGFAEYPNDFTLMPGTLIDRYGTDFGSFTSPLGTPYEQRALAPGTELKQYSIFEVLKPIKVKAGEIAPWFNQPGGGTQYKLPEIIDKLLGEFLRRIDL